MTGDTTIGLSPQAQEFQWLLGKFVDETQGVTEAIAVSADGLLIAASTTADPAGAQRLAAVVSGMISLAGGAARSYHLGGLHKVIVDMTGGYFVITAISETSVLGVIAERSASLGGVAYDMTMFAARVGHMLTPATIAELKKSMV